MGTAGSAGRDRPVVSSSRCSSPGEVGTDRAPRPLTCASLAGAAGFSSDERISHVLKPLTPHDLGVSNLSEIHICLVMEKKAAALS